MSAFDVQDTVGDIVARRPVLSDVFERADIDYCCSGKKTVEEACREKGLDPQAFLAELNVAAPSDGEEPMADAAVMYSRNWLTTSSGPTTSTCTPSSRAWMG